jgi:hypothetical protein
VKALASLPKGWTGLRGCLVSGLHVAVIDADMAFQVLPIVAMARACPIVRCRLVIPLSLL